jgi:hypothetical protein
MTSGKGRDTVWDLGMPQWYVELRRQGLCIWTRLCGRSPENWHAVVGDLSGGSVAYLAESLSLRRHIESIHSHSELHRLSQMYCAHLSTQPFCTPSMFRHCGTCGVVALQQ